MTRGLACFVFLLDPQSTKGKHICFLRLSQTFPDFEPVD